MTGVTLVAHTPALGERTDWACASKAKSGTAGVQPGEFAKLARAPPGTNNAFMRSDCPCVNKFMQASSE